MPAPTSPTSPTFPPRAGNERAHALSFTKMQACGNDFIVIDDRQEHWLGREPALARALCPRRLSIGADGLLVLRGGRTAGQFEMVFVNADGLIGEMCGNGARCLAAFIRRAGLATTHLQLRTPAGLVEVDFGADFDRHERMSLALPAPGAPRTGIVLDWQGQRWPFTALDVGAPHAVCLVATRAALAATPVAELGRYARHHAAFGPRGANINFAATDGAGLYLRTYERGVEAETLGCGTGAAAAALTAHMRLGLAAPVTVHTRSAETVTVHFRPDHGGLRLEGGAHFVADGRIGHAFLEAAAA